MTAPGGRIYLWWAIGVGLLIVAFATSRNDAFACDDSFEPTTVPADWATWLVAPDRDGLTFDSEKVNCVGHGLECGHRNATLAGPRTCPTGKIGLDAWFSGGIGQGPEDIRVRVRNGIFVVTAYQAIAYVSGHREVAPEQETMIGAFRRDRHPPSVFAQIAVRVDFWLLVTAALSLFVSAAIAMRILRRSRRYEDKSLFRRGTRDETGTIRFKDDTPPIAPITGKKRLGPVLVRLGESSAASYRKAGATRAIEIVESNREGAIERALERIGTALMIGFVVAFLLAASVGIHAFVEVLPSFGPS